jgi:KipI family sensor histidine kinase inhibitor
VAKNGKSDSQLYESPRFLQAGDSALTVELGNVVAVDVNEAVTTLEKSIADAAIEGVLETIPTYRSLQVLYNPETIRSRDLIARLKDMLPERLQFDGPSYRWLFPVCYGGEHGMDLEFMAETHKMSVEEVIRIHSEAEYRVYMIGFAPGFAYLGGLPEVLHTPRRVNPRIMVPARSISLGGIQAAIYSFPGPSGWHMLGQTPVRSFDLNRDEPFLLKTGDCIRFRPVSHDEYKRLDAMAERGDIIAEREVIG